MGTERLCNLTQFSITLAASPGLKVGSRQNVYFHLVNEIPRDLEANLPPQHPAPLTPSCAESRDPRRARAASTRSPACKVKPLREAAPSNHRHPRRQAVPVNLQGRDTLARGPVPQPQIARVVWRARHQVNSNALQKTMELPNSSGCALCCAAQNPSEQIGNFRFVVETLFIVKLEVIINASKIVA